MGGDLRVLDLDFQNFGYLYLADEDGFANVLRDNLKIHLATGAETEFLSTNEIKARYPFHNVEDIKLGSINLKDED